MLIHKTARISASIVGAMVLFGVTHPALAQTSATRVTDCDPATPTNAICVTHGVVNTRIDGLPTVFPVTYRVEQKVGAGAFVAVVTEAATKHYIKNLAPGDYVFRVIALENLVASDPSSTASKSIIQAPPSAPVIVIAATIRSDGPPIYRIVYTIRPREGELVFLAPESMRSLFR